MTRVLCKMLFFIPLLFGISLLVIGSPVSAASPVTIGSAQQPLVSLVMLAEELGYFSQEGQPVTFRYFPSGKQAFEALLAHQVDISTVAETPLVFSAFNRSDYSIFSTIGSSRDEQRIVVRSDRGINKPSDLRGKRIATQHGSAVHFFLHLFLLKHGLTEKDIILSFKNANELPKALASGEIDGFCIREPFISEASRLLNGRVKMFKEPDLYVMTFHMVALNTFIQKNTDSIARVNRALLKAEEFATRQPQRAIEIIAKRLKISIKELKDSWADNDLRVSLEQSLLLSLEDQARWAMDAGLVKGKSVPNFLRYIQSDSLRAVKPAAVTIIR